MSILILGGQGNLGEQLKNLFSDDYELISWDKKEVDVLDFKNLILKIRDLRPNLIINAVAYNAVDLCEDPLHYPLALKLNSKLPALLADLALEQKATLIHYSSDYVFNGTKLKLSFREEEIPNPINKYGESKAQGEQEILARGAQGLQYYLIRTSKLFGPRGSSSFSKPSFFDIILASAEKNQELAIVNEELSSFTYTPDLARVTKSLWESKAEKGIYHLINEDPCTWYAGAQELFSLLKRNIKIRALRSENLLRPARRPKFSVLENTKFRKLRSWKKALKEYLSEN